LGDSLKMKEHKPVPVKRIFEMKKDSLYNHKVRLVVVGCSESGKVRQCLIRYLWEEEEEEERTGVNRVRRSSHRPSRRSRTGAATTAAEHVSV